MKVLILIGNYLPGFKGGGPTRSIAGLVAALGDEFDFYIVTRDRDLGDLQPFPNVRTNSWMPVGNAQVAYLASGVRGLRWFIHAAREVAPDAVYLNSFFDWQFCLIPSLLARVGLVPRAPTILAARGQFAPSALQLNAKLKKAVYIALHRGFGFHRRLLWHVTNENEKRDVERAFGEGLTSRLVPNLCHVHRDAAAARKPKRPGELSLVFLARVVPVKNLLESIDLLLSQPGKIALDIWGPIEDAAYWKQCQERIARLPENISVRYRGTVAPDRVADTLACYDALLLPTRGENFGHVIVEALAAGCPVVISDRTPWRDLQKLGVGWDLPLESAEAFGQTLTTLTDMDEATHRVMRSSAAEFGRTIVDRPDVTDAYRAMFHAA